MTNHDPQPESDTKGGERPGDSLRELAGSGEKVGATEEEVARQQANVEEAAREAERIKAEPGHHGREHL